MGLLNILGAGFLIVPILLTSCQSQNETFIAGEIAQIPVCGVSGFSRKRNFCTGWRFSWDVWKSPFQQWAATFSIRHANVRAKSLLRSLLNAWWLIVRWRKVFVGLTSQVLRGDPRANTLNRVGQDSSCHLRPTVPISQLFYSFHEHYLHDDQYVLPHCFSFSFCSAFSLVLEPVSWVSVALTVLLKPYWLCAFLAYTAVAVRLITRYCLHQTYRLDDYFIVAAAVSIAFYRSNELVLMEPQVYRCCLHGVWNCL